MSTLTRLRRRLAVSLLPLLCAAGAHADFLDSVKQAAGAATSAPAAAPATTTASSGLIGMVTDRLGVTDTQASGGLGALFSVAKQQLSGNQFSQIASAVPGMDGLLAAAPAAATESKSGGLLAQAGQYGKALQGASYLNGAFKQLGLSPEMISSFADIAGQYLQSSSPAAAGLLKQVTGAL